MLKVVVFDSGYGGELFADYLSEELPVIEIIRVIDWRNTDKIITNSRAARKIAERDLRPYIGRVDLIIFANYLLSLTSLKYFKRKYKNQKFLGLKLEEPSTFKKHDTLILTTKAVARTINYYNFLFRIKRKTRTLFLDSWISKIDDGELNFLEIRETILTSFLKTSFAPKEIILGCAQFNDIKIELANTFETNVKIYDGFADAVRRVYKVLKLRGGIGKRKK